MFRQSPWDANDIIRGNAGQRTPRSLQRPYAARVASDLEAGFDLKRQLGRGVPVVFRKEPAGGNLSKRRNNGPEGVVEASYPFIIAQQGVAFAQQVIPKNLDRRGLIISNPNAAGGNMTFSFNSPLILSNGLGGGIGVSPADYYEQNNDIISVDAIYVWSDDPIANYPIAGVCYEAVPVSS